MDRPRVTNARTGLELARLVCGVERAFSSEEPLVVYGAPVEGRPAALGVFWRNGSCLQTAANVNSPSFSLLAESTDARQAVIDAALADGPRELEWRQLLESGEDAEAFVQAARARRYKLLRARVERAPFVKIGHDWEAYTRTHPGRTLIKDLRRGRRRLAEQVRCLSTGSRRNPRRSSDSWPTASVSRVRAGRAGRARRSCPYRRPPRSTRSRPLDGPGILFLHDELERAFGGGVQEVDLLGGSDAFKMRWADGTRVKETLTAFAPTLAGRAAFVRRWCEMRARRAARRALRERAPRRRH